MKSPRVLSYACGMGKTCKCGEPATRLFLCAACHREAQQASYWRKKRVRKLRGIWVPLASTPRLLKAGLITEVDVIRAVMEAAKMNGWVW